MEIDKVLEEHKDIMVERLKFEPSRLPDLSPATVLPKDIEGSLGLDSLDFIELSIAIEERFGITVDESEDLSAHFTSFATLSRFIAEKMPAA